jgi:hypothetical protein
MRSVFLSLALVSVLAACVTKYPNGPPLREVETDEDRQFLSCVSGGIYTGELGCDRYISGRDR